MLSYFLLKKTSNHIAEPSVAQNTNASITSKSASPNKYLFCTNVVQIPSQHVQAILTNSPIHRFNLFDVS